MPEICKISLDGAQDDCSAPETSPSKIEFAFGTSLSARDIQRKNEVKDQLVSAAKKCVLEGNCGDLDLVFLRWKKCGACDKHAPELMDKVIKPLIDAGVGVKYSELNAKADGKDIFIEIGCQGTPCIAVKDPATGAYKKAYDGVQKDIAAMSSILGLPNPLFYGDVGEKKPSNLLKSGLF